MPITPDQLHDILDTVEQFSKEHPNLCTFIRKPSSNDWVPLRDHELSVDLITGLSFEAIRFVLKDDAEQKSIGIIVYNGCDRFDIQEALKDYEPLLNIFVAELNLILLRPLEKHLIVKIPQIFELNKVWINLVKLRAFIDLNPALINSHSQFVLSIDSEFSFFQGSYGYFWFAAHETWYSKYPEKNILVDGALIPDKNLDYFSALTELFHKSLSRGVQLEKKIRAMLKKHNQLNTFIINVNNIHEMKTSSQFDFNNTTNQTQSLLLKLEATLNNTTWDRKGFILQFFPCFKKLPAGIKKMRLVLNNAMTSIDKIKKLKEIAAERLQNPPRWTQRDPDVQALYEHIDRINLDAIEDSITLFDGEITAQSNENRAYNGK